VIWSKARWGRGNRATAPNPNAIKMIDEKGKEVGLQLEEQPTKGGEGESKETETKESEKAVEGKARKVYQRRLGKKKTQSKSRNSKRFGRGLQRRKN